VSSSDIDQVWEPVKTLTFSHQRRLPKLFNALRFTPRPLTPEDELDLRLLKDGVIDHIRRPLPKADRKAFEAHQPVPITGKPLSESIIEERR
jgi:hypothetical protein